MVSRKSCIQCIGRAIFIVSIYFLFILMSIYFGPVHTIFYQHFFPMVIPGVALRRPSTARRRRGRPSRRPWPRGSPWASDPKILTTQILAIKVDTFWSNIRPFVTGCCTRIKLQVQSVFFIGMQCNWVAKSHSKMPALQPALQQKNGFASHFWLVKNNPWPKTVSFFGIQQRPAADAEV